MQSSKSYEGRVPSQVCALVLDSATTTTVTVVLNLEGILESPGELLQSRIGFSLLLG